MDDEVEGRSRTEGKHARADVGKSAFDPNRTFVSTQVPTEPNTHAPLRATRVDIVF